MFSHLSPIVRTGAGILRWGILAVMPFLPVANLNSAQPVHSGVSPNRATLEVAQKMQGAQGIHSMRGRSLRSEIRLVMDSVIGEARQSRDERALLNYWSYFSDSPYAKNRGLSIGSIMHRGHDLIVPVDYEGEKAEIRFYPAAKGYGSSIRILESLPEPETSSPVLGVRSEARSKNIQYSHSSTYNLQSPGEEKSVSSGISQGSSGQRNKLSGINFASSRPDQIDRMPVSARVTALTQGIDPDSSNVTEFANAQSQGIPAETAGSLAKRYPVTEVSEAPGALIFATARVPTERELIALRTLLLMQKRQYLRIILPEAAVTPEEWKKTEDLVKSLFTPFNSIGNRFLIQRVRFDHFRSVRQEIYNAMRAAKIPAIGSQQELSEKFLVQWLDESAASWFNREEATDPTFAKILESRIGAERSYPELMAWAAANAMKISQGVEASRLKQSVVALIQEGRLIEYRVNNSLRNLVSGFLDALQIRTRIEQSA